MRTVGYLILTTWLALAPAWAGGRRAPATVDLFSPDGQRQGYAVVQPDGRRVDAYDAAGTRLGYGHVESGRLELFDGGGRRLTEGKGGRR